MKTRLITGGVIGSVLIALFIFMGINQGEEITKYVWVPFTTLIAIGACYEIVSVKGKNNGWNLAPYVILGLIALSVIFINFSYDSTGHLVFEIGTVGIPTISSIHVLIALMITIPLPIFSSRHNSGDGAYLFTFGIFIGIVFKSLNYMMVQVDWTVIFTLAAVATATDTFALFGGMLFGKHKMNKRISPKKTWEGAIVGTIFAIIIGTALMLLWWDKVFYKFEIDSFKIPFAIFVSGAISIMSQVGDFTMSAIKRNNDAKDFSNLFPGHGGILDRIDSFATSLITYTIFHLILVPVVL